MTRIFKILASLFIVLIVLVLAAVLLFPKMINPNDYRTNLEATLEKTTGFPTHIKGNMAVSIWPNLGFSVADVRVDSPSGAALAVLKSAQVQVKLLPLFHKQIALGALNIDGLTLSLEKNPQGIGNWTVAAPTKTHKTKSPPPPNQAVSETNQPFQLTTAQVNITHVNIQYQDQQTHQQWAVHSGKLSLQGALGEPLALEGIIPLQVNQAKWQSTLKVSAQLRLQKNHYQLNDLHIALQANHQDQMTLQGHLSWMQEKLQGQLSLESTHLKSWLGYASSDASVLQNITASATFNGDTAHMNIQPIHIKVDDSTFDGKLQLSGLDRLVPVVRFQLSGSPMNLDRYLPKKTAKQTTANTDAGKKTTVAATEWLSSSQIHSGRQLDLKGTVHLDKLTIGKIPLAQIALQVSAKNGLVQLSTMKAKVLSGDLSGSAKLDIRSTPTVSGNVALTHLSLANLGRIYTKMGVLEGSLNAHAVLATLFKPQQLLSALNGSANFSVKNGAFNGVNADHLVCQAVAMVHHEKLQKKDWPKKTLFTTLQGKVKIRHGVIYSDDLRANLEQFHLLGQGQIDLPKQSLDYRTALTLSGESADSACIIDKKYREVQWPIRCKGRFDQTGLCQIDGTALAKEAAKLIRKKLTDKLPADLQDRLDQGANHLLKKWFH